MSTYNLSPYPNSWRSPKIEKRDSPINGTGVFAASPISRGELLWIKGGHIVHESTLMRFPRHFADYALQISDQFFLAPLEEEEIGPLVIFHNHSCEPNVGPEGQICFVAMRDIAEGEELCCDYAMIVQDEQRYEMKMKCNCGTPSCRGVISGQDWRNLELQKRYGTHFSSFILRRILEDKGRYVRS